MRSRGRPRTDSIDKKTNSITIRVTDEEHMYIQACADELGKTISNFAREVIMAECNMMMESWEDVK